MSKNRWSEYSEQLMQNILRDYLRYKQQVSKSHTIMMTKKDYDYIYETLKSDRLKMEIKWDKKEVLKLLDCKQK